MARALFIRVMAQTYDEKEVPETWPSVFAAVWPEPGIEGAGSAKARARLLTPGPHRGVLELIDGFSDYAHYGEMPEDRRKRLIPAADKAMAFKRELEEALGNRDVRKAESLCVAIEESLDEAETLLSDMLS